MIDAILKLARWLLRDPYCDAASTIHRREITADEPKRRIGKLVLLGVGYGTTEDDPPHYLNWKTACRHRTKDSCRCHDQMGNDFWFLPADRCLFDDGPPGKP